MTDDKRQTSSVKRDVVVGILRNMAQLEQDQADAASIEVAATVEGLKETGLWSDVAAFAAADALREAAEVIGGSEEGTAAVWPGAEGHDPRIADDGPAGGRWRHVYESDPIGTGGDAMTTVYYKVGEDYIPLPGQVAPESSETGHEEAWIFNLKDMVDDWSARRARNADTAQLALTRGGDAYDSFAKKMEQEYLDERQVARTLQMQLNSVFANALQMSLERMGTKQDVSAENLHVDPSETASEAISAGLANQAWTQGAVQTAIASDVAETLRPSIVAMGDAIANAVVQALSND